MGAALPTPRLLKHHYPSSLHSNECPPGKELCTCVLSRGGEGKWGLLLSWCLHYIQFHACANIWTHVGGFTGTPWIFIMSSCEAQIQFMPPQGDTASKGNLFGGLMLVCHTWTQLPHRETVYHNDRMLNCCLSASTNTGKTSYVITTETSSLGHSQVFIIKLQPCWNYVCFGF